MGAIAAALPALLQVLGHLSEVAAQVLLVADARRAAKPRVAAARVEVENRAGHVPEIAHEEDLFGAGVELPGEHRNVARADVLLREVRRRELILGAGEREVPVVDRALREARKTLHVSAREPGFERGLLVDAVVVKRVCAKPPPFGLEALGRRRFEEVEGLSK